MIVPGNTRIIDATSLPVSENVRGFPPLVKPGETFLFEGFADEVPC